MQIDGEMGNVKRNPGEKKKREVCQELTGGETRFPPLLNRMEYGIASLTPGILCIQGVNARRSKTEIAPNSIMSAVFSSSRAHHIMIQQRKKLPRIFENSLTPSVPFGRDTAGREPLFTEQFPQARPHSCCMCSVRCSFTRCF